MGEEEPLARGLLEEIRGASPPDVALRIPGLGADAAQRLARAEREPLNVDVGPLRLELALVALADLAAVGAVDDERRPVGALGGGREERGGEDRGAGDFGTIRGLSDR